MSDHPPGMEPSSTGGRFEPYEADEHYEERLAQSLEALDALPRDDDWEHTRRVIENAPGREELEAAAREFDRAQALLGALEEARYTGTDPAGLVTVVIDVGGRIQRLEFDVAAVGVGARTAAAAVKAAWDEAESEREADGARFEAMSRELGGPGR